jgi:hypothetical protein
MYYVRIVVNIAHSVNIEKAAVPRGHFTESLLEKQLWNILPWPERWSVSRPEASRAGPGWDFLAVGQISDDSQVKLLVECKAQLSPIQFLQLRDRKTPEGMLARTQRVLAVPRISPRMAELCQESGWGWYDLAGNCRLEIPGLVLIERTGKQPVTLEKSQEANLGTPEASRVVRTLLAADNAKRRWTQREMVEQFQKDGNGRPPSLALVNKVVQSLKNQAYIEYLPHGGFQVQDPEGLIHRWCQAYPYKRHQRLRYFTLLQGKALQEQLGKLDPEGKGTFCYMGFSAADFQAAMVRQPRTWLYMNPDYEEHLRDALKAKPVDSGENLVVFVPFELGVFDKPDRSEMRMDCTNLVQTYLDLTHSGGRGEEAATAILEQRLKPAWAKTR